MDFLNHKNKDIPHGIKSTLNHLKIGMIDTGVNPWHSQVRGLVDGCHIYLDQKGKILEDDDFRDFVGHGTVVAGILRRYLPASEIFSLKVFERDFCTYPSLVARAVLRAAAEGCSHINLSLCTSFGPGSDQLVKACESALHAGCIIVAAGKSNCSGLLPASIPGVIGVIADDRLPPEEIVFDESQPYPYSANGSSLSLDKELPIGSLFGNSFACARVTAHLAKYSGPQFPDN